MALDFRKSVTFVPILYVALKLSWMVAFIFVALEERIGSAPTVLQWRNKSNVYCAFLWLALFCEPHMDRFVLAKTLPRTEQARARISLILDFTLVLYAALFQGENTAAREDAPKFLFFVWAACALVTVSMETRNTVVDEDKLAHAVPRASRAALCATVAGIMSSGIGSILQEGAACTNVSQALSLYAILCTIRCYVAAASRDNKPPVSISNVALFSCVFFMRLPGASAFVVSILISSFAIVYTPQPGGHDKEQTVAAAPPLPCPAINDAMLAQMQEMERGMGSTRRKSASMFD